MEYKKSYSRCATDIRRLEPFKEQESNEVKENENCCCHLRKKVLLTGFAQIAKSKRCPRITIKLFVFFLCTSGFLHQTWDFLQMYLAYPTMLDISEEYPDSFIAPAITICNRNRLLRQPYCKTYPEKCTWQYTTWETFCHKYRRMCPETKPPDFNFGVPLTESVLLKNRSNAVLSAVGPQEDTNIILLCVCSANGSFTYCNHSTFQAIQVPKNTFPYRCLSLFSLLGEQYGKQFNLTLSGGFYITLDMQPEEYFNTIDLVQASVALHDPRKAVNPMTEGITLTAGKVYQFYATMERRESLPSPYASKCRDYLNEWKKNGGIGPLSKDDCVHECKIKALVAEYGCVGHSITYPNNYEICNDAAEDVSYEVNRLCASSCQDACEENIFHVTFGTASDLQGACDPTDEYCKSRSIVIWVDFDRLKVKKFKQIPRIESIELFSYIGGYLGMWLGISLASTFDLAELIYDIFDCTLPKRKRNQKTTTPIEQFRHHTAVKKEKNTVKRRKFSL